MSDIRSLIEEYSQGSQLLKQAIGEIPDSAWDATLIKGQWTIRQVICHLADAEIIYADRMKRVIAEDNPTMLDMDPNVFVPALHCSQRSMPVECDVIDAVRRHMVAILECCDIEDFQRTGVHSDDGPMTLESLLERITGHIPHHIQFIQKKLATLG